MESAARRGAPVIVSEFASPSLVEVSRIQPRAYLEQLLRREDYEGTDHIGIMARPRP